MKQNLTIGRPLVILTGGIATGKSAVAQRLQEHSIDVVDTDRIAHALTAPGGAALAELREAFGDDIFAADGTLDRAALRDIVFNDTDQKTRLEQILHPMIRRQAIEALAAATSPYVVADVPLFAETGFLREQADRVLVVDCPPKIQKQRLLARGGIPEDLVELILQAQAARETRLELATEVLDNSGTPEQRDAQLDRLHQSYLLLSGASENIDKNPASV